MKRALRWCSLALTGSLLSLAGCVPTEVWLEVPSFGSVDGLWLWRLSEETGTFERACRIRIGDPVAANGHESVAYVQDCASGEGGVPLSAELVRDAKRPGTVRLGLWFAFPDAGGTYRVSAYGPRGESALSATPLAL